MAAKRMGDLVTDCSNTMGLVAALVSAHVLVRGLDRSEAAKLVIDEFDEMLRILDGGGHAGGPERRERLAAFFTAYFARGHAICTGADQT